MSYVAAYMRMTQPHAARLSWRPFWSQAKCRAIVWQALIIGAIGLTGWYLIGNASRNLAARHIATGFDFLGRVAGIPIGESPIPYDAAADTFAKALLIGVLNTLKVSVVGILFATLLGTLIGIARLSANWLLSRLAALYVETVRDIPLLLQLLFWYALLHDLPAPRQAMHIGQAVFLSNRGIKLPILEWQAAHSWAGATFVVGLVGTLLLPRHLRLKLACLTATSSLAVWAALGAPLTWQLPVLRGFNFQGGATVSPEYFALLLGLTIYTAAYIAEIVRSGIQSVPSGQWEAGRALGLHRAVILRKIVLPQALRVMIPPLTSQFLNLTKNSSLAVAIGYQDVVSIANTTLNQTGQAIEGVAYIMAVYLTISLSISGFANWYNRHVRLIER